MVTGIESTASWDFLGFGVGFRPPALLEFLTGDFFAEFVILIVFSEFVKGLLGRLTYVLSQTGID